MAARIDAAPLASIPEPVDLRQIPARRLERLLEEETGAWMDKLDWDFSKSAELVLRFVDMHALNGFALVENGEVEGYAYYVAEEHKALVGDLFVRRRSRTPEREMRLLGRVLDDLAVTPYVRRIEAQLMMMATADSYDVPHGGRLNSYERNYMMAELGHASIEAGRLAGNIFIERWADHFHEAAGQLIAASYAGHVDSLINDQYRSVQGARRFLFNIVQHPGCGAFFRSGSVAAFEAGTGRLCGISLASLISPHCGHITQLSVAPHARARGLGRALICHSLAALREAGCARASLTVTAANHNAIALYERLGFRIARRFSAFVWEGF